VLQILSQAGFSFNLTKCSFVKSSVEYLGFLVKDGKIRPNPRKVHALNNLPPPQSVTQVRQFMGLASYFRQFVPRLSELSFCQPGLAGVISVAKKKAKVHIVCLSFDVSF